MQLPRQAMVERILHETDLDGIVFFHSPNLHYLGGFTGSTGGLLFTSNGTAGFVTDSRYTSQAKEQMPGVEVREAKAIPKGVVDWLSALGCRRIGFEAETLPCAALQRLEEHNSALEWVPQIRALERLRCVKASEEISKLDAAAAIGLTAFAEVLPYLRPGVRERDFALELEIAVKRHGGDEKSFDFIVASGPRGALPHGIASQRVMQAGELVTIDFGVRLDGYHHDETVTVALGEVSDTLRSVHTIVLQAHDLALEAISPGASIRDVDAVGRDYIARHGYGEYFGHGLGHGVGLEVHEWPSISPRSDARLEEGMVVTVEPGIYLPGVGGVRIEDMVLVTAAGGRVLTKIDKRFCQLPV